MALENKVSRRDLMQVLGTLGLVSVATSVFGAEDAQAQTKAKKPYTPLRIDQLGPSDGGHKTIKEALAESRQQLVLHYGENIVDADIVAELLREKGIPATAYSGGLSKDKMFALLNGKPISRYNQKELDTVATFGLGEIYKSKVGEY